MVSIPVIVVVLLAVLIGASAALQGPMTSLISARHGGVASSFIVHLSGAAVSLAALLFTGMGALRGLHTLPWWLFLAGLPGLVIISALGVTLPRIGATATITLAIAGQIGVSLLLDQMGWLGIEQRPVSLVRLAGVGLILMGAYLTTC